MKFLRWLAGMIFLLGLIFIIFGYLRVNLQTKLMLYLLICFMLSLVRVFRGPTPADRSVATDIFGILVIGFCAILAVYTGKDWYMDIAIAWGLQSFIGVLALAKFLEGRNFDD
ncbi:MAG: monovalent cation/H+ antiporter complex subunit F [Candidatus Omnitrophica bacterium]|nr:monovalent cation/H+ antiporter complex subunit F [Candidatus Omnitrophota bacterium]MDD5512287.1 monovalent cation/H+ antiporter complex subunit F [Candidatus Omnitrophota bacterium]